ncbi:transcriptional regulator [Devosia pacifica]|uniref:Transcriptional regulator n=1 Tax=Devosia pacifica TaxID=1335967 RepID=A0A918SCY9_9HYPH|nr:FadR/GntR family transcriptional regulator [Devosia pacifica]GHA32527.1 transcriptional regulator [Devosia pacifica]
MKLQSVSNRKLYVQIADQIRELIATGAMSADQQLPSERDLAAELGVSRPTVREALIALEVAGLIDIRVGVGAFVRRGVNGVQVLDQSHSPVEVMKVRLMTEPEAAALAAENADEATHKRLQGVIADMRWDTQQGQWSSSRDEMLHMSIADACNNSVLREVLATLWRSRNEDLDRRFHSHLAEISELRSHILVDHQAIVEAILSGNPEGARTAMSEHLRYVENAMFSIWD